MKKLTILLLIFCVMVAVSCKKKLAPDASQSGNPADLITTNGSGSTGSITAVTAFVNKYAGVYYSAGDHIYVEWGKTERNSGLKVDYKFRDGKIYTVNHRNQATELVVQPVEAVLPSANKLQLSNYQKGEILVLNMTDDGLESYVSYILEKVSDDVLIENKRLGYIEGLEQYKGTYNSIAQDNKIENYIAIDGEGYIYFHDANVTEESGRVGFTEGEGLTIVEAYQNAMRKIIFKFDQGVYRRYSIDGENRDETYIGICEVTKDFIEDIPMKDAIYKTQDYWDKAGRDSAANEFKGVSIKINEPKVGHVTLDGAVCISGEVGDRWTQGKTTANCDQVGHISILKDHTLIIMGRYNAVFTFSDDWQTATYDGKTLKIVHGSVKNVVPSSRKTSTFIPLKRR